MVEQSRRNSTDVAASRRRLVLALAALGILALGAIAASVGQGAGSIPLMLVLLAGEVLHAWPAALYLLAAYGMGRLCWPLWRDAQDKPACQLASGLAVMLTLSHLLGVLGLLSPAPALALCAVGVALAVRQIMGWKHEPVRTPTLPSWVWLFSLPVAAVVLVAMGSTPGVLWGSEFGGFDVLSYHLQLPQEWIAAGRLTPLEHNVYSYLPGYVEAAFAHVALLSFPSTLNALIGEGGWRLTSAQALHAGLWACAAWLMARAGAGWLRQLGVDDNTSRHAGAAGGVLVATTPWTVVVGSMAYNEMAVIALCAGAILIASEQGIKPLRRGILSGLLVGVAAGAKPSAALMAAPLAGVLLLGAVPLKQWRPLIVGGLIAGTLAVLPWLLRNAIACGNPVFPFMTDLFGTGHWTTEQAQRWSSAHHAEGSLGERLRLLVASDPNASALAPTTERHRGMSHPQWAIFFPAWIVLMLIGLLIGRIRRTIVLVMIGSVGGLVVWLALTHHQSRFLLPMVLAGGLTLTLVVGDLASRGSLGRIALTIGALLGLVQSGLTWRIWSQEGGGVPALSLGQGSMLFTRSGLDPELTDLTPTSYLHRVAPDLPGKVYMLGGTTPLYMPPVVVYHTTWDASPIAEAVRTHPDDPMAWIAALREAGISHVLIHTGELARLEQSGWLGPEISSVHVPRLVGPCTVVKVWPEMSQTLFKLPERGTETGR